MKVNGSNKVFIELGSLEVGGIEVFSISLANHLCDKGFDVNILTLFSGDDLRHLLKKEIRVIGLKGPLWRKTIQLYTLYRKGAPFACFSQFPRFRLVAMITRVPKIYHIFHSTFKYPLKTFLIELLMKRRTVYIGVSDHVVQSAKENLKLKNASLIKIHHGIDLKKFKYSEKDYSSRIKVCIVGRLVRAKRIDETIDIAARVPKKYHNRIEFHVFGEGELKNELKHYANKKIPKSLVFEFEGVSTSIQEDLSDFHILLSTPERAGFEIVLIEAMAMGLCVVAYDMGPISEVVGEQGPGVLVRNRDQGAVVHEIISLLQNPVRMRTLSRLGRKRVEKQFNLSQCLNKYSELLER